MARFPVRPWGLGMDSKGNIYTSLLETGEVVMLKDDGSYQHIAWVPSKERAGKDLAGLTGLDKADNIYVVNKAPSKYDDDDSRFPRRAAMRRRLALGSIRSMPRRDRSRPSRQSGRLGVLLASWHSS
jgi:hypothetical protein